MDKELLSALHSYVVRMHAVLSSIADSHYVMGSSNSDFKQLTRASKEMLDAIEKAKTTPTT